MSDNLDRNCDTETSEILMNLLINTVLIIIFFVAILNTVLFFSLSMGTFSSILVALLILLIFIAKYVISPKFDRQFKSVLIENSDVFLLCNSSSLSTKSLMKSHTYRTYVYIKIILFRRYTSTPFIKELLEDYDFRKNVNAWQIALCKTIGILMLTIIFLVVIYFVRYCIKVFFR